MAATRVMTCQEGNDRSDRRRTLRRKDDIDCFEARTATTTEQQRQQQQWQLHTELLVFE